MAWDPGIERVGLGLPPEAECEPTGHNPSFDCVAGRHLWFDVHDTAGAVAGGWCPWCGTGAYDPERIGDDGRTVGFVAEYRLRIPDGFTRRWLGGCRG